MREPRQDRTSRPPDDHASTTPDVVRLVEDGTLVPYEGGRPLVASAWKLDDYAVPAAGELTPAVAVAEASPSRIADATVPRRPRRRGIGLVLLAALTAAAVYWIWSPLGAGGPDELRLTGVLMASDVVVSSLTTGRIRELRVDEGTVVEPGGIIARLDRDEMLAERTRQEAAIAQLTAKLDQGRESVSLREDRSRGDLVRADANVRAARSQHDEALADLEQRRSDMARAGPLRERDLLSAQEYQRLETSVGMAGARLRSLGDQVAAAEADRELSLASQREVTLAYQNVTQIRAELAQARAALARVKTQLGYTDIVAPLRGRGSVRVARQGEVVNAGDPIVTIVNLDDVWASAHVEEGDLWRLQLGQAVPVETASGERVTGTITFVSPEAAFATQRDVSRVKRDIRTFGIKAALPNPGYRLHPGMTVYLTLPQPAAASAP